MNTPRRFPPPPLDYDYAVKRITQFIDSYLRRCGAKGYVIGLSGGIDSSVTAKLLVEAVGSNKVFALIMPDNRTTPLQDVEDAKKLAKDLGIEFDVIEISRIVDTYLELAPFADPSYNISVGNLRARIRMTLLYLYANRFNYLVCGTGDKSELLLGYFTKYGDGGVDILPIGDVYKTQVRELGRRLGIPREIVEKPSSPRLWPGHMAEEELGIRYDVIDAVLYRYVDLGMDIDSIVEETGIDREVVLSIVRRVHRNEHKRKIPPIPRVSKWCLFTDWKNPIENDFEPLPRGFSHSRLQR